MGGGSLCRGGWWGGIPPCRQCPRGPLGGGGGGGDPGLSPPLVGGGEKGSATPPPVSCGPTPPKVGLLGGVGPPRSRCGLRGLPGSSG